MTRDDLIERLAANRAEDTHHVYRSRDEHRAAVRREVMRDWPVIFECVSEWLLHDGYAPAGTIQKWREEMAP